MTSRQVRADFDDTTVVVYQAYRPEIGDAALRAGSFVLPFSMSRMTWIKPSFLWMAYRSGWATKESQERVLAIRITRAGFDWALAHASLSAYDPGVHASREAWEAQRDDSPIRVQWDPERDIGLRELPYRSLQVGIGTPVVPLYVREWVVSIEDATQAMRTISALVAAGDPVAAQDCLPLEVRYPVEPVTASRLGMMPT